MYHQQFLFHNVQGLYFMRVVNPFIIEFFHVGLKFQRFLERATFQRKRL